MTFSANSTRRLDVLNRDPAAAFDAQARQAFDLAGLVPGPPGIPAGGRARDESRTLRRRRRSARACCWPAGWWRRGSGLCRSTGIEAPTSLPPIPAGTATPGNRPASRTCWCPPTDRAYSALLEDLDRRGLLDETLVVCMAEFGRTPRLDGNGGRNHWGSVFSVALAGGGIRGGQVYGASDRIGAYPAEGRVRPEDLSATIFHCLGIHPQTEYHDPLGGPTRSAAAKSSMPSCNKSASHDQPEPPSDVARRAPGSAVPAPSNARLWGETQRPRSSIPARLRHQLEKKASQYK